MKKPCPLSARSRLLSVKSMLPWVNCCATLETRTPLPIALLLTPCGDTENSSANSAREPLKPDVAVLAMLLAVTVRSACAAFKPLKARRKVMEVSDYGCDYITRRTSPSEREPRVLVFKVSPLAASIVTLL